MVAVVAAAAEPAQVADMAELAPPTEVVHPIKTARGNQAARNLIELQPG